MRIYLAGYWPRGNTEHWKYHLSMGKCAMSLTTPWMVSKRVVAAVLDYTGPYVLARSEKDVAGEHQTRLAAIRTSDFVFSWCPDEEALFELGLAVGAGVKAYASMPAGEAPPPPVHGVIFFPAQNYVSAVVTAYQDLQKSGHFENGTWRKMVSKFGSNCRMCEEPANVGDDIMWRKKEGAVAGEVMHLECFLLNAPPNKMDDSLQAAGMEVLRDRVRRVEEENARLVETIKDLA